MKCCNILVISLLQSFLIAGWTQTGVPNLYAQPNGMDPFSYGGSAMYNWWRYMDANCDGILQEGEAVNATAQLLSYDPVQLLGLWEKTRCTSEDRRIDKPSFFTTMIASFVITGGRLDWTPCRIANWDIGIPEVWNFEGFRACILRVLNIVNLADSRPSPIDQVMFRNMSECNKTWQRDMDCLCEEAWQTNMDRLQESWQHDRASFRDPVRPMYFPTFQEIMSTLEVSKVFEASTRWKCVTKVAFGHWSTASFKQLLPVVNFSRPCAREPSASKTPEQPTRIIAICIGLALTLCLATLSGVLCHRRYRLRRQHARSVQLMLKAKIDTWSTFDDGLRSRISSLEPTFAHDLGLNGCGSAYICLQDMVHPDDKYEFQTALEELKQKKGTNELPVKTIARLRFGFQGSSDVDLAQRERSYTTDPDAYVRVELLMSWGYGSFIVVGMTSLNPTNLIQGTPYRSIQEISHIVPVALGTQQDRTPSQGHSSLKEYILNGGSDLVSSAGTDARTFVSMEARDHLAGHITRNTHETKDLEFREVLESMCEGHMEETNVVGNESRFSL